MLWLLVTVLTMFIFSFTFVGWWAIAATYLYLVVLATVVHS